MEYKASALSFEQVCNLLHLDSSDFKKIGGKQIFATSKGRIFYRISKNYRLPNKNWWYSINPQVVMEERVDFLCLVADHTGAFLIPSDKFLNYRAHNTVGKVKGGREHFTIVKEGTSYIRRESKCQDWDISEYFTPAL